MKSSEAKGEKRIYGEEEAVELNRFLTEDGSEGFLTEFVEDELIVDDDIIEVDDGEENDYWSRNGAESSSETVIFPEANKRVEEDLLKRIRYQNGREVFEERAYLVGIERKGAGIRSSFGITESLEELGQLADTAGLTVVGTTYQK